MRGFDTWISTDPRDRGDDECGCGAISCDPDAARDLLTEDL